MQTTPAHPGMIMMTSSNGNISRVTGPLCGEFTGPGEFPSQRPVTRSFVVFFDLRLNKRLSKQLWGWWFEKQSRSLWRHCNDANVGVMSTCDTWNSCFCDDHIVLATWYLLLIINMVLDRETLFLSSLQGDLISNDKNALIGYHLIFREDCYEHLWRQLGWEIHPVDCSHQPVLSARGTVFISDPF